MMYSYFILILATFILSQAGNVIRFADAHPIAVTFFRLFFALLILIPFSLSSIKRSLKNLNRVMSFKLFLMGIFFALHFFFWIQAVQTTKVAHAAICFALNPVFITIGAYFIFKEKIYSKTIIGLILSLIGIFTIGYGDFSFQTFGQKDFIGDLFALLGGLSFAIYFLIGKSMRHHFENRFIMTTVYFIGSVFSLILMQIKNIPLFNYSSTTWITFGVLALFQTIVGHASIIYVLKFFKSSFVSTFLLLEPLLASIVAFFLFQEKVSLFGWVGYCFISIGIFFLIRESKEENT